MRYVDDLGKVKPEDIQCIDGRDVVEINKVNSPYPCEVVFSGGHVASFTEDGRFLSAHKEQHFIFKDVKYVLIPFNDGYEIHRLNGIYTECVDELVTEEDKGLPKQVAELLVNALNEGKISI